MLHWIAEARARLIPPAPRPGALLLDVGCGGGLLAPHLTGRGYRHVGVDLSPTALVVARDHGVGPVARADVSALPLTDGRFDVVVAGEILEHVTDLRAVLAEACRVLRPGGTLVVDTLADTWLAGVLAIDIGEHLPGGAPKRLHDRRLFVDRRVLVEECARHGVALRLTGLRPGLASTVGWLLRLRPAATMVPTRPTSVLFQGVGVKQDA